MLDGQFAAVLDDVVVGDPLTDELGRGGHRWEC